MEASLQVAFPSRYAPQLFRQVTPRGEHQGTVNLMSDLTFVEKRKLEKLFDMQSGYVLDLSNRSLRELVVDSVGLDIYDIRYESGTGSKANRLRTFWRLEPNHVVGKVIADLISYYSFGAGVIEQIEIDDCLKIADRLVRDAPVPEFPVSPAADLTTLANEIRESIRKGAPQLGLDRLHTYTTRFLQTICERRGIDTAKDKPLHSLVGEYVKSLRGSGHIESEMTERILKSTISILEAFNTVRNERSYAHPNPVLNQEESFLVLHHVIQSLRFMEALERRAGNSGTRASD